KQNGYVHEGDFERCEADSRPDTGPPPPNSFATRFQFCQAKQIGQGDYCKKLVRSEFRRTNHGISGCIERSREYGNDVRRRHDPQATQIHQYCASRGNEQRVKAQLAFVKGPTTNETKPIVKERSVPMTVEINIAGLSDVLREFGAMVDIVAQA